MQAKAEDSQSNRRDKFGPRHIESHCSCFIHFDPEIILLVMTGKFLNMTLVEEHEMDLIREREIKDYNPSLNAVTKYPDEIVQIFDEKQMSFEGI